MVDFCITAVKYTAAGDSIEAVRVHEELPKHIGTAQIVPREFVATLIRKGKASFHTRVLNKERTSWVRGADVHVLEDVFLTTDPNNTKRDNLGSLPTF